MRDLKEEPTIPATLLPKEDLGLVKKKRGTEYGELLKDGTEFSFGGRKYRVVDTLGIGGMGEVRKIEDLDTGEFFSFKTEGSAKGARYSAERELQTLKLFEEGPTEAQKKRWGAFYRPVPKLFADGIIGDIEGLDGNLIEKMNLYERIFSIGEMLYENPAKRFARTRRTRVDPSTFINMGLSIFNPTLRYFHSLGFVHMDIKPGNILVRPVQDAKKLHSDDSDENFIDMVLNSQYEVVMIDHGSVVYRSDENPKIMVTYRYMPWRIIEEQFKEGKANVDYSLDIYSATLSLWECLVGEWPYNGYNTIEELVGAMKNGVPPAQFDFINGRFGKELNFDEAVRSGNSYFKSGEARQKFLNDIREFFRIGVEDYDKGYTAEDMFNFMCDRFGADPHTYKMIEKMGKMDFRRTNLWEIPVDTAPQNTRFISTATAKPNPDDNNYNRHIAYEQEFIDAWRLKELKEKGIVKRIQSDPRYPALRKEFDDAKKAGSAPRMNIAKQRLLAIKEEYISLIKRAFDELVGGYVESFKMEPFIKSEPPGEKNVYGL